MSGAGPFGLWTVAAAGSLAVHGIVGFTLYAMPMPEVRQTKPTEIRFASPDQGTATALAPAEAATALVARGVARAAAPAASTALSGGRPASLGPSVELPSAPQAVAAEPQSAAAVDRLSETAPAMEAVASAPEAGAVEPAPVEQRAVDRALPLPADPTPQETAAIAALDEASQAAPDVRSEGPTLADRSREAATEIQGRSQPLEIPAPGAPDPGAVEASRIETRALDGAGASQSVPAAREASVVAALDKTPQAVPDVRAAGGALSDRSSDTATAIAESRRPSAIPPAGIPSAGAVAPAPVKGAAPMPDEATALAALDEAPQPLEPQAGSHLAPLPDILREQVLPVPALPSDGSQAEPAHPDAGVATARPAMEIEKARDESMAVAALDRQMPAVAPATDSPPATATRPTPAAQPPRTNAAIAPEAAATRVETTRPAAVAAAPVRPGSPAVVSGTVAATASAPVAASTSAAAPVVASRPSSAADAPVIGATQAPAAIAVPPPLQPQAAPITSAPASTVVAPSPSGPASTAPAPEAEQRTALILQPTITPDPDQGSPAGRPAGKLRIGDFLETREGDDCLLAVPAGQGTREASVEAFAVSEEAVARLGSDYEKQSGLALRAATRPVSRDQCSALIFARSLPQYPNFQLRLTVSEPSISSGRVLHGVVSGLRKDTLYLVVVDDEGKAKLLDSYPGVRASLMTFSEPVHLTAGPVSSVQLLIAVAADGALRTMPDRKGMPADEFFSRLATEIVVDSRSIAYGITSFVVR